MQGRRLAVLTVLATLATAVAAGAAHSPDRIDLPNGWQPEGVASGHGNDLFVGSIPTGAVLRADARTGETETVVSGGEGRAAIGLKADRHERLFVSGGPTGKAFVYDAKSGGELAQFQLAPSGQPTFVNDVTLTRDAAYFTDSQRPVLYVVDTGLSGFKELPLKGFEMQPGFNLNGIVAVEERKHDRSKHGDKGRHTTLLAVQSNTGQLWRIDARSGRSERVDLGGASLANGDGLLLSGRTLYAVQNQLNQIAVLKLKRGLDRAKLVRTITHPEFDVPTTIARKGHSLWAANARFNTPPTPDTPYWLTRVDG
jgi:sugar lactone lactonase YvrE